MDWATILKVSDLGVTALIGLALLYSINRQLPKWLEARAGERQEQTKVYAMLVEMFRETGQAIGSAQTRSADAIERLADVMARHDGESSASMDALQIAIGSVDKRADALGRRVETMVEDVREIKAMVPSKLDQILVAVEKR